ncbi:B12-binding domain-containing radical SAM protein [Geothrix edaphica]|uniref:B12-binding domain-containing radical SAM protein n=1 Tax=Geothrix edaphica TaxID=2927976 RepID=A0ABQ5PUY2_9BACT|nr:B12-binding domain-containing radical SAM protein [Geothrix edaphica]GLH65946.1 B12-binding domain-containing radical SAM protein [Geothrix edaphica]
MGRRVLLVYPEMPPTYWSMRYALPFIGKKAVFPPLGLLTVAAMLPEGFEVSLVDLNVEPLTEAAVARADLVFISAMIVQKESMAQVVQLCNRLGKPVVAGGPYPTSCHDQIAGVDHFVLNEAEVTLPLFLHDYALGRAKPLYASTERPDLTRTPAPRFDLVRRKDYAEMALQFSRGCPYDCEFCDIIELFGRRPRTKTPAQFLHEMDLLYAEGWRGPLFLVDDNFIGNRREVRALLAELIPWQQQRHHPFTFFTEASLDLASDEPLLDQMAQAGFNMVFLGIETPDLCALQAAGKRQNLKADMLASIRKIQRKGLEVSGGFIVGFDSDGGDIFERQVRFIQEAAIPTAMVGLLTALPRTRLHRRLEAEGRLTGDSGGGNNTHDLRLNFLPRMDTRKLIDGYKRILAEIYRPDRYFERCLKLLKTMKPPLTSRRKLHLMELRAFVRSLVVQTFSRYGWTYWRFLVQGFLARPLMVPETVTLAVKGHHFFKMTRSLLELERFKASLQELARTFEGRLQAATPLDFPQRLAELKVLRDQALSQTQARYQRLPKDFRAYADDAVAAFRATLEAHLARLAGEVPLPASVT